MKIIDTHEYKTPGSGGSSSNSSSNNGPTAITIGKFEAMHLGHRALINATIQHAKNNGLNSAVLSFVPHPAQVLQNREYMPIYSKDEQALLLKEYDIDYWIPFLFDQVTARKSARDFCRMLADEFHCRAMMIGEDFRLGRNREGTQKVLQNICREFQIEVIPLPHQKLNNEKISTNRIRSYLAQAQIQQANKLLGRPFFISGAVKEGRQLGRTIGFPTANIQPGAYKFLPPDGVYAVKVVIDSLIKTGIANIGTNPTVARNQMRRVEIHILDFNADIYNKEIIVEPTKFIRPEQKFKDIEELKAQITEDVKQIRGYETDTTGCETDQRM